MNPPETLQRITRLAPLAEVVARLNDAAAPVAARNMEPVAAVGSILAADAMAAKDVPASACALRDGWAVAAERVTDAGPYAPAPLDPAPIWVEASQPMPSGTDAVLPVDAVAMTRTGAEAHAAAAPGEGVMVVGADIANGTVLRRAGQVLRPSDVAVLAAAGIRSVSVRSPRVKIFSVTVPTRSREDTLSPLIARAVEAEGCIAQVAQASTLEAALTDRASDIVIGIGSTGTGKRDAAVKTLARVGKIELHGLGITPGETAAFGTVDGRAVLLLPGRLDAALAAFLIVGSQLLARCSGKTEFSAGVLLPLTKKVTSTVGLAEFVPVRRAGSGIEPLGSGILSLQSFAQADGWVLVPPESEGMAAGAIVEMRAFP
ncbi:MAG TPA: molybdopterin-binding protein [Xanthobacteraceae bacterium]|nr:molybdopterin-binding protein [Xanthobacteraceae bacterium]